VTFPGAGAQVYYNEAGEPTGWDYPGYDEGPDPDDFDVYDDEPDEDDKEDEPVTEDRDPHPTHCCQRHGCKYGHGVRCTVARIDRPGKAQVYPCEQCDYDMEDDRDDADTLNAMYDLAYARGVTDTTAVAG
jgi:hypothetical protein